MTEGRFEDGYIWERCIECRSKSKFIFKSEGPTGLEFRRHREERSPSRTGNYDQVHYRYSLVECLGCGRGALAVLRSTGGSSEWLSEFHPVGIEELRLPSGVPEGVEREFAEAERCAKAGAYRGALALLRSALEKALLANGYGKDDGKLYHRIEKAADDGIIHKPSRAVVQDKVREMANDVLHGEWKAYTVGDYETSRKYVQRVIEGLYEHRQEVLKLLTEVKRVAIDANPGPLEPRR